MFGNSFHCFLVNFPVNGLLSALEHFALQKWLRFTRAYSDDIYHDFPAKMTFVPTCTFSICNVYPPKRLWFTSVDTDSAIYDFSRQNSYFATHLVTRHLKLDNNGWGEVCHVFVPQTCREHWTALCDNITTGVLHCITRRRRRPFHFGDLFRCKAIFTNLSSAIFWRKKDACAIVNDN